MSLDDVSSGVTSTESVNNVFTCIGHDTMTLSHDRMKYVLDLVGSGRSPSLSVSTR